ncbi:cysteine desulfurase [Azospirillum brasilense]|uniref:Cysteine desulfurase n=1 Tax=Azospirillum brasilense TaxID=192 RepID=A0A0P0F3W1_AZOBR|nr:MULTISPECIES: urate hydroxylase PuuD [Azospirillum]ALJ37948.1 cysteine desulfurase [Azospirillum brasilense]MDW7556652.1 urate hydroxylase PuuD [Azospirillum brasilense]MDW7596420.1 urate hydroxylase PuuD [Azospirillum brasilense]MDW7631310.1 urate hydroxylase PuuD [Azospirillum brasilense]MDX5951836.1 urate hydroxylase PuuD [Azospirillum brasilense]
MEPIVWEWVNFLVRWLHVITAIAWIGSSFYFIHLDLSLRRRDGLPNGVAGEAWQVHGGGFYNMMKYTVAPPELPEKLTWFKWEAYATWLSGFALLSVLYYHGAALYMIDPAVLDIPWWGAVLLSLGALGLGWHVYDRLCKSPLGKDDVKLAAAGFVFLVLVAWGLSHLFSGRAAMLHVGALIGTMMSANVFRIIIPNQTKAVAAMKAGQVPDPALGKQAKQRSLHNNYLTLPVVFLMISNHYPLAFGTRYSWVIVAVVLVVGAVIRHFFNSRHAGKPTPWWTWAVAAAGVAVIVGLSAAGTRTESAAAAPARVEFAQVEEVVLSRCSMCHAAQPVWEGIGAPPRGVMLDSAEAIGRHAPQIRTWAALSDAMPPGNVTGITPEERRLLAAWTDQLPR